MKNTQDSFLPSKSLDYFLQLTETMNYTQAAQILGISQPALTQQIKKIEHQINAPLFYSIGKKLYLSDAGYTLLDAVQRIYKIINESTDKIQQSTDIDVGLIRIGILSSIEDDVFVDFAGKYLKKHKSVELSFIKLSHDQLWKNLEDNTIDLAIMYLPDSKFEKENLYIEREIIEDELCYMSFANEINAKQSLKIKDLDNESWISYPEKSYFSLLVKEKFQQAKFTEPRSLARFTQSRDVYRFAKQTKMPAILPLSSAQAYNQGMHPMNIMTFSKPIKFNLSLVYRRGKDEITRITNVLDEFDDYLVEKNYLSRLTDLNKME